MWQITTRPDLRRLTSVRKCCLPSAQSGSGRVAREQLRLSLEQQSEDSYDLFPSLPADCHTSPIAAGIDNIFLEENRRRTSGGETRTPHKEPDEMLHWQHPIARLTSRCYRIPEAAKPHDNGP